MSPTFFVIYINGLLSEIEKCQQGGIKFSANRMSGLLFADDLVGLAETRTTLQSLIDVVYNYSKCWHFEANVKKSALVILSKLGNLLGKRVWGQESLSVLDSYCYLGIKCSSNESFSVLKRSPERHQTESSLQRMAKRQQKQFANIIFFGSSDPHGRFWQCVTAVVEYF